VKIALSVATASEILLSLNRLELRFDHSISSGALPGGRLAMGSITPCICGKPLANPIHVDDALTAGCHLSRFVATQKTKLPQSAMRVCLSWGSESSGSSIRKMEAGVNPDRAQLRLQCSA
jgi:hypothetical protein